jgi:hypothetical protein
MGNVYKVTEAIIGETKRGFKIYKLQLNNSILATKLVPFERKYDKLFRLYEENNNSLKFLVGKYISISLSQSQYGFEFDSIISFDVLKEFKELLDRSQGKAFLTGIDIYDFLKTRNYSINQDNSITLKDPYGNFNVVKNGITICYPNNLEDNCLSLDNIKAVYNQFYKDKAIDNGNPDLDCKYALTPVAIVKNEQQYHKYKGGIISNNDYDVLRIGDSLSEEQYSYILNLGIRT